MLRTNLAINHRGYSEAGKRKEAMPWERRGKVGNGFWNDISKDNGAIRGGRKGKLRVINHCVRLFYA